MSDTLTRRFRSQLTVAMDAVLRKAVIDIVSIFENSMDGYRKELSLKDEQLIQLARKLERTELQLTKMENREKASGDKEHISCLQKSTQIECIQSTDVAVQTSAIIVELNYTEPLDPNIPETGLEDVPASSSPQEEMTPDVNMQRLLDPQSFDPKMEPEAMEVDHDQPSTENEGNPTESPHKKKMKNRNKRNLKVVERSPPARANLMIYLRDGNSSLLGQHELMKKQESGTSVVTEPAPDSTAPHLVLQKQITDQEKSGNVKMACSMCTKQFIYPKAYERHMKGCTKSIRHKKRSSGDAPRRSSRRSVQEGPSFHVLGNEFTCIKCHNQFDSFRALALHMRKYKLDRNEAPTWTEPIEDDLL